MRVIVPVVTDVVLVNAGRGRHALVPTRARRRRAALPRIALVSAASVGVVVVVRQVHLVVHHFLVDQLLPLVHRVLPLVHAVVVGTGCGLKGFNS